LVSRNVRGDFGNGSNRVTGRPDLVMTTSSPASTAPTSLDKGVFVLFRLAWELDLPALIELVPVPLPTRLGLSQSRGTLQVFQIALQVVITHDVLKMLADLLVDCLAGGPKLLPRPLNKLPVDGEGNIHSHSICAHITCVKF
jgi:hypothetical protein